MRGHTGLRVMKTPKQLNLPLQSGAASHDPMRRCIVSGESYTQEELLRFAVSPEGGVVFDAKRNLPGRGLWLYPRRDVLETAMQKNLLARAAKQKVTVPADLPEKVEKALRQRMLNLLQRGVQSREMLGGFEKVQAALEAGEVTLLIHAADAGEDGVSKLNKRAGDGVDILQPLPRETLAEATGIPNPVHLAVKSHGLAQAFMAAHKVWAGFLNKDAL